MVRVSACTLLTCLPSGMRLTLYDIASAEAGLAAIARVVRVAAVASIAARDSILEIARVCGWFCAQLGIFEPVIRMSILDPVLLSTTNKAKLMCVVTK